MSPTRGTDVPLPLDRLVCILTLSFSHKVCRVVLVGWNCWVLDKRHPTKAHAPVCWLFPIFSFLLFSFLILYICCVYLILISINEKIKCKKKGFFSVVSCSHVVLLCQQRPDASSVIAACRHSFGRTKWPRQAPRTWCMVTVACFVCPPCGGQTNKKIPKWHHSPFTLLCYSVTILLTFFYLYLSLSPSLCPLLSI